jgi:hypothetical protein
MLLSLIIINKNYDVVMVLHVVFFVDDVMTASRFRGIYFAVYLPTHLNNLDYIASNEKVVGE